MPPRAHSCEDESFRVGLRLWPTQFQEHEADGDGVAVVNPELPEPPIDPKQGRCFARCLRWSCRRLCAYRHRFAYSSGRTPLGLRPKKPAPKWRSKLVVTAFRPSMSTAFPNFGLWMPARQSAYSAVSVPCTARAAAQAIVSMAFGSQAVACRYHPCAAINGAAGCSASMAWLEHESGSRLAALALRAPRLPLVRVCLQPSGLGSQWYVATHLSAKCIMPSQAPSSMTSLGAAPPPGTVKKPRRRGMSARLGSRSRRVAHSFRTLLSCGCPCGNHGIGTVSVGFGRGILRDPRNGGQGQRVIVPATGAPLRSLGELS